MPRLHDIPELRTVRRRLRGLPTQAEAVVWKALRRRQLHDRRFRRQHSIGHFVVDFYCPAERLAIEIDGGVHADPARSTYDTQRQRWLEAQGIRVLRFTNDAVLHDLDLVVTAITAAFDGATDAPVKKRELSLPPRSGEGGQPGDRAAPTSSPLPPAPSPQSWEGKSARGGVS